MELIFGNQVLLLLLFFEELRSDFIFDFGLFLPILFNSFDFLSQSQKLNHLLGINFGSGELCHIKIIFVISIIDIVLVFVTSRSGLLELYLIQLRLLVVHLGKLGVDDSEGQVEQEEGPYQHHRDEHDVDPCYVGPLHISLDLTPTF